MLQGTNSTLKLTGMSGREYLFSLYTFDSFNDLKNAFKPLSAVYVFTKRSYETNDFCHDLIYLGETSNLANRYDQHHKESSIVSHGANCIGLYVFSGSDETRLQIEKDLLDAYDFPCNS